MTAFRELHEYGESTIDDISLLACMKPDGGLDIMKFQFKEKATMFELSLLNEAGLIDNDTSPTRKVIELLSRLLVDVPGPYSSTS